MAQLSIEQVCRDLLELAIEEGLVEVASDEMWGDPHPQARSAGELVELANFMQNYIRQIKGAPKCTA